MADDRIPTPTVRKVDPVAAHYAALFAWHDAEYVRALVARNYPEADRRYRARLLLRKEARG